LRNPDCGIRIDSAFRIPQSELAGLTMAENQLRRAGARTVSRSPGASRSLDTSLTIHELSIERTLIVDYLKTIEPDKLVIALVHALEVGVTEMLARRERFRH